MPIKSLESYLFERKLVNTSSIEVLQNATIGIDVEHYLSRIYTFKKEQFLFGIGGIPSSLKDYIKSDLQVFKEFNIKPIFVISGLNIQLQMTDYNTNELSPQEQHLENTWAKLNSKNLNPYGYSSLSNDSFRLFTDPLPLRPMINDLVKYFIESDIDYLIAPYEASFQLSYLYQRQLIDSIYGSTDLLLTKVDKFILGMEFQSKDFRFIDKVRILTELNLTERQLIDLSLMVGCSVQPITFPNLPPLAKPIQPYAQLSYFKIYLEFLYLYTSFVGNKSADLYGYVVGLNDPRLLELYSKGYCAIKYIPVLNKEGYVQLYSQEMFKLGLMDESDEFMIGDDTQDEIDKVKKNGQGVENTNGVSTTVSENGALNELKLKIPNDLHDILSQRLPPELYFYGSIGLLKVQILESITTGKLFIRPPLESGLSSSYRKLILLPRFIELLDSQYNLITQLLARYYQVKKIKVHHWFRDEVIEVNNRMIPPVYQKLAHLLWKTSENNDKFTLLSFFKTLPDKFESKGVKSKDILTYNDVMSTVMLRTLYLLEILDTKTNELGSTGKILRKFAQDLKKKLSDEEFQSLMLLLLLIKSKTLNLAEYTREFSGVPKSFKKLTNDVALDDFELSSITLISRIFSLHRLNISPINYQGPISRALVNFRSHVKFISENIVNTVECLLVDFIVHQEDSALKMKFKGIDEWHHLIKQIPFFKDCNNTLLGIVAEIYFEYAMKQKKASAELAKEDIIQSTNDHLLNYVFQINNTSFNINVNGVNSITAEQLLRDFRGGFKFWSLFLDFVVVIHQEDPSIIDSKSLSFIQKIGHHLSSFIDI